MNNNRVCRFEERLEECLPQLDTLVLTNNNLQELTDIEPLKTVKSLTNISFFRNPITTKPNYRYFVIHCLPQVRVLDFQRVKLKERQAAQKLFSGQKGELLKKDIAAKRSKTFEVKDVVKPSTAEDKEFIQEKYKDQEAIKNAIANASTLEEVRKLELLLQQGHIPGKTLEKDAKGDAVKEDADVEETEEMDDDTPNETNNGTNGVKNGVTNGDIDVGDDITDTNGTNDEDKENAGNKKKEVVVEQKDGVTVEDMEE